MYEAKIISVLLLRSLRKLYWPNRRPQKKLQTYQDDFVRRIFCCIQTANNYRNSTNLLWDATKKIETRERTYADE